MRVLRFPDELRGRGRETPLVEYGGLSVYSDYCPALWRKVVFLGGIDKSRDDHAASISLHSVKEAQEYAQLLIAAVAALNK